jgi:processive 1,2-diacylglycerol beta-glucosyltransferase
MAEADCLIQNAGGMTCIEAIDRGLPVLMFNPIRGLGEFNAYITEQAGAASWVRSAEDLRAILRSASRQVTSLCT